MTIRVPHWLHEREVEAELARFQRAEELDDLERAEQKREQDDRYGYSEEAA